MKTNKIYLMITILLGMFIILSNTVNASSNFTLKLSSTKTSYSKGDTVTVNIDLSSVAPEDGVSGYQGKIVYDSNVLTFDNITASAGWEVKTLSGAIIAYTSEGGGKTSGTTAVATFKVNENTTLSSTSIKISNVKGSTRVDGKSQTVEGTSSELKITIATDNNNNGTNNNGTNNNGTSNSGTNNNGTNNNGTSNNGTNNNGTSNSGTNNNGTSNSGTNNNGTSNSGTNNNGTSNSGTNNNKTSNSGTNNNKTNNNKVNNTSTGQKIPYAGAEDIIGIVVLIAIIGIASYIRYRKTL